MPGSRRPLGLRLCDHESGRVQAVVETRQLPRRLECPSTSVLLVFAAGCWSRHSTHPASPDRPMAFLESPPFLQEPQPFSWPDRKQKRATMRQLRLSEQFSKKNAYTLLKT